MLIALPISMYTITNRRTGTVAKFGTRVEAEYFYHIVNKDLGWFRNYIEEGHDHD